MKKQVTVIGSINMDTKNLVNEFPEEGNSENTNDILSTESVLGGKGANQAIATLKQSPNGTIVNMIGCVGKDEAGYIALKNLKDSGVNISGIKVLDGKKTDGRIITVDKTGENRMMGYGDCIKELLPNMIDESTLLNSDIIAIQLKMPRETVEYIINFCRTHNKKIVIDPTPLDKSAILTENNYDFLNAATYLTPNEEEAFALILHAKGKTPTEIKRTFQNTPRDTRLKLIEELVKKYPNIIATIGENGVIYNQHGTVIRKATYPTKCIDSTGAGDTFNGAFMGAMVRDARLETAIEYGLMTSSIKVKSSGAQEGVPTFEETQKAIDEYEKKQKTHIDD